MPIKLSIVTGFLIKLSLVLVSGKMLVSSGTASRADTKSILILRLIAFIL